MRASSSIFSSKKGTIIKSLIFLITTLLIIGLIGFFMESEFETTYLSKWIEETDNIEILILGSSQAEAAYDERILTKLTGKKTKNISAKGQQPDSTYYILKDLLKKHRPQLIILDVYWRTLDVSTDLSQLIRSYNSIIDQDVKSEFFKEGFSLKNRFEYSVPILRYRQDLHWFFESSINNLLSRDNKKEKVENPELNKTKSIKVISEKKLSDENKFRFSGDTVFNETELNYLIKIVELCKENNIELMVVAAPILPESIEFVKDYPAINKRLTSLFEERSIKYYDFNLKNSNGEIVDKRHFKDENHMNSLGAELYSLYLYDILF